MIRQSRIHRRQKKNNLGEVCTFVGVYNFSVNVQRRTTPYETAINFINTLNYSFYFPSFMLQWTLCILLMLFVLLSRIGVTEMIPTHVVQTRLSGRPSQLQVSLPGGTVKNWMLIWNEKRKSQCHIGYEWYNFVNTPSICFGSKIQLWDGDSGIMSVTIFKMLKTNVWSNHLL